MSKEAVMAACKNTGFSLFWKICQAAAARRVSSLTGAASGTSLVNHEFADIAVMGLGPGNSKAVTDQCLGRRVLGSDWCT